MWWGQGLQHIKMKTEVVILKLEQTGWGSLAHGKIFGIVVCFVFFLKNILGTVVFDLRFFFPESFPWQFSGPVGKHWDIHQMWIFRVPGRMLHATCKKCPSWFFQKLLMNTLALKGLLRVSKVVEYKVSDTAPHRNSYFSSHSWTKVPTWKLQVSGRML